MNILLSGEATAEVAETAGGGMGAILMSVVLYGGVLFLLYFFMMRPQKKEQKRLAAMLSTLENGDCVLTTSGFYGIVIDINDDMVIVEFGNNKNCRIPMEKSAISRVEKANEA